MTNDVYKEALWKLHANTPQVLPRTAEKRRANSTLHDKLNSPMNTSLDGFRNFTIDPEWEFDLKQGAKSTMKN